MFKWLLKSNRILHLVGGCVIMDAVCIPGFLMSIGRVELYTVATISTVVSMLFVEFKDVQQGNKFDWLDVLAGTLSCLFRWSIYMLGTLV